MKTRLAGKIAAVAALVPTTVSGETVIVGSSTVAPFARAVIAEHSQEFEFLPTFDPKGSNAGIEAFCAGEQPLTVTSLRMSPAKLADCNEKLGTDIVETILGKSGVVLMTTRSSAPEGLEISREHLFRALASHVPDEHCELQPNTAQSWIDVDPALPDIEISVIGPSASHGVRSTFERLALVEGAGHDRCLQALEKERPGSIANIARQVRTDGPWQDMDDERITFVDALNEKPGSLAVLAYGDMQRLGFELKMVRIDDRAPTKMTVKSGTYPLVTTLYMYSNEMAANYTSDMRIFADAMRSQDAIGPGGYLTEIGLIPRR